MSYYDITSAIRFAHIDHDFSAAGCIDIKQLNCFNCCFIILGRIHVGNEQVPERINDCLILHFIDRIYKDIAVTRRNDIT